MVSIVNIFTTSWKGCVSITNIKRHILFTYLVMVIQLIGKAVLYYITVQTFNTLYSHSQYQKSSFIQTLDECFIYLVNFLNTNDLN